LNLIDSFRGGHRITICSQHSSAYRINQMVRFEPMNVVNTITLSNIITTQWRNYGKLIFLCERLVVIDLKLNIHQKDFSDVFESTIVF